MIPASESQSVSIGPPFALAPTAILSNAFGMTSMGKIDPKHTVQLLLAELVEIAARDGTRIPTLGSAMGVTRAYRTANDSQCHQAVVFEPSKHRGVALARALGLLSSHEIMRPLLEAMRRARIAADAMMALLGEFCAANNDLRRLGQRHTPLFEGQEHARRLSLTLTAARLRMPPSFSSASDAEQEEALLMNVTRCLSVAFETADIARLVDDRGGGDAYARRARVRTRKRTLGSWDGPLSELWFIPDAYGLSGEEIGSEHSASSE